MKKLSAWIVTASLLFYCPIAAYAQTQPAASRGGDVLSAPSGSVMPQPVQPPADILHAQTAQYVVYAIAAAVVLVLLLVFRRKYKRKKSDE